MLDDYLSSCFLFLSFFSLPLTFECFFVFIFYFVLVALLSLSFSLLSFSHSPDKIFKQQVERKIGRTVMIGQTVIGGLNQKGEDRESKKRNREERRLSREAKGGGGG